MMGDRIPPGEPMAVTAGEQDHSDPWMYAGEVADPPEDCGEPPDDTIPQGREGHAEPVPETTVAAAWRNCGASLTLISAVNARWPGRDKSSDGTIGDQSHANRASDHNPNAQGVVRARDIDVNGIDVGWLFEWLRQRAAGDPRLAGGGYLILNRRITAPDFSGWRAYTGSNPHTGHGHVSFSRNASGYDLTAPWNLGGGSPAPSGRPVLRTGATGAPVEEVQRKLGITVDGKYGPATVKAVKRFQESKGITADGVCGPATWRALGEDDMPTPDEILRRPIQRAGGERSGETSLEAMAAYLDSNLDLVNAQLRELRALLDERLPKAP